MNAQEARMMADNHDNRMAKKYAENIYKGLSNIISQQATYGCYNAEYKFRQSLFDYEANIDVYDIINKFRTDGYNISVDRKMVEYNDGHNYYYWTLCISW